MESTFANDSSGGRITDKVVRPDIVKMSFFQTVVYDELERFRTDATVPEGFPNPVPDLAIVLANGNVAGVVCVVTDTAYGFVCLLPHNGPGRGVVEERVYHLSAFCYRLVRWPSCTRAHVGV